MSDPSSSNTSRKYRPYSSTRILTKKFPPAAPSPEPTPATRSPTAAPTSISDLPGVPPLRSASEARSVVDRVEVRVPHIAAAKVVDAGLLRVAERGFDLPKRVRQVRLTGEPAMVQPAGFVSDRPDEFFVNRRWPGWARAADKAQINHQMGWWSTPAPEHPIFQEAGHVLHVATIGRPRFDELERQEIIRAMTLSDLSIVRDQISYYAARNAVEFVAEVFAMLVAGREISPRILTIYYRLGGP